MKSIYTSLLLLLVCLSGLAQQFQFLEKEKDKSGNIAFVKQQIEKLIEVEKTKLSEK